VTGLDKAAYLARFDQIEGRLADLRRERREGTIWQEEALLEIAEATLELERIERDLEREEGAPAAT
jgi:hypothetical protein